MESLYTIEEVLHWFRDPPAVWRRAEEKIVEEYDLEEDHAPWHDARDEDDEPVEIKSCASQYDDGRVGEFAIWEFQRVKLLLRGRVALLVYIPGENPRILATQMVMPHTLADIGTVYGITKSGIVVRRLRRIPWPEMIALENISLGVRHHYAHHYSDQEVRDAFFLNPEDVEREELAREV